MQATTISLCILLEIAKSFSSPYSCCVDAGSRGHNGEMPPFVPLACTIVRGTPNHGPTTVYPLS
ncbi:hypothetical protein BS78_04G061700 [Paspalum vaginatum]|nr:hypothetical protein BS78_04G061700 [Paspalum vaginatum]